ncbi:hypothetical protein ACI7YW_09810 [Clostridium ljungdahlii]
MQAFSASKANVLLLDEPTNYLDMQSIVALEDFLKFMKELYFLVSTIELL